MKQTLGSLAEQLGGRVLGNAAITVTNVASITSAAPGSLVFVEDLKGLERALASPTAAVIAGEFAASAAASKPLLIVFQPRLTFARAARLLSDRGNLPSAVHPSAVVAASARIGTNVAIGAHAVLGENVKITDG